MVSKAMVLVASLTLTGAALPGQDNAAASAKAEPANNPADWIGYADYPPASLRAREAGTVAVRLVVDSTGRVTACQIVSSSGYARLDEGTCATLVARAQFVPGPSGRTFERRIVWKIPEGDSAVSIGQPFTPTKPIDVATTTMEDYVADVAITVGFDGRVESCRVIEAKPTYMPTYPCAQNPPGTPMGVGYVRAGKPIKAIIHRRMTSSVSFE